jgi:hypothetical protein
VSCDMAAARVTVIASVVSPTRSTPPHFSHSRNAGLRSAGPCKNCPPIPALGLVHVDGLFAAALLFVGGIIHWDGMGWDRMRWDRMALDYHRHEGSWCVKSPHPFTPHCPKNLTLNWLLDLGVRRRAGTYTRILGAPLAVMMLVTRHLSLVLPRTRTSNQPSTILPYRRYSTLRKGCPIQRHTSSSWTTLFPNGPFTLFRISWLFLQAYLALRPAKVPRPFPNLPIAFIRTNCNIWYIFSTLSAESKCR